MGFTRIHHVQVAIPEDQETQARHFYGDILGLAEIPKPVNLQRRGGVWFETGIVQLHLGVDPAFMPAIKAHIALQFDDLDAVRARFSAAGFPIFDDEPLPGYVRFYSSDPFGNRIELLSPSEA